MPAKAETVVAWAEWLADGNKAPSTVNAYVAAVASAHRLVGHPFNRAQMGLQDTLAGIRRVNARATREAKPLLGSEIQAILADFELKLPSDARDAALLTVGFAGALRRSELVGLDWQEHGEGDGFVALDERGIVITLLRSKGGKGEPEEVIVPAPDMPTAIDTLRAWATLANLQPGAPIFRPVDQRQNIGAERLTGRSVDRIIKARVNARYRALGWSKAQAAEGAQTYSGHSMRAGYCTAAALVGTPEWKIRRRSRHRTPGLVARYVRAAEDWTDSGLKGIGF